VLQVKKILLVGGGSGGHITPLLAIASEIKKLHKDCQVAVVSEKLGVFNHLFDDAQDIDDLHLINAGKFRRYYGRSFFKHFLDPKTFFLNLRDLFRFIFGIIESFWLLIHIRPNIIFIKGGYVGVPVGLIARLMGIPYITHDSDAKPGLTNRLIGKRALLNAVGMPLKNYRYKKDKIVYVGVPISDEFKENNSESRSKKRKELDLTQHDFLLLVTGGSNGARRMDKMAHAIIKHLLDKNPRLHIVHQVGKENEDIYSDYPAHLHSRIRVAGFLKPLSSFIAASDTVISRAGATAISEIGAMERPLIIIPNPYLTGGHQLKNAELFSTDNSAIVVNEHSALENPKVLAVEIQKLIDNPSLRSRMSQKLYKKTKKNASLKIAELLIDNANNNRKK
jgi:UDP-N-acetylglucosamine--N-acetylmuramyl-(pentapeptide) pyrophosphoryl-undecaprenol N-acetylglucosamine transferase